jgi:hypothetical protein
MAMASPSELVDESARVAPVPSHRAVARGVVSNLRRFADLRVVGSTRDPKSALLVVDAQVERGYDLTLVSDAHSTEPLKLPDGRTVPAESIVADLNAVFQWVSAPDVRTEVKTTAEVAF